MIVSAQRVVCAAPSDNLEKMRKRLQVRLKKLQSRRNDMEDRRRKQLWKIATTLDEIARLEASHVDARDDAAAIEVKFSSIEASTDEDSFDL